METKLFPAIARNLIMTVVMHTILMVNFQCHLVAAGQCVFHAYISSLSAVTGSMSSMAAKLRKWAGLCTSW